MVGDECAFDLSSRNNKIIFLQSLLSLDPKPKKDSKKADKPIYIEDDLLE